MKVCLQVKKGFFYGVVTYNDEAGNKLHKWLSTGIKERGSKKEARAIAEEKAKKFEEELICSRENLERRKTPKEDKARAVMLFSEYCKEFVVSNQSKWSPEVYAVYSSYIKWIKNFFDERRLRLIDITEKEIGEFHDSMRRRGLKEITIKKYNNILRPVLKQAFQSKLIPDNPFDYMEPIHQEKSPIAYYDKNEMKKLFKVIKDHKLEVPFTLAAYYGFRRSEVLGLRWSSIDFEHKLITINHKLIKVGVDVITTDELKSKTSHRTLPLIPPVEELLRRHKAQIEENKSFYGNSYDTRYLDYVCVEENGKVIFPDYMTKQFVKMLKKNKMRQIRLHDLRHSCASNMLANGVPLKEIQEWLGHSDYAITANVYSHLDFASKVQAANTLLVAYDEPQVVGAKEKEYPDQIEVISKLMTEMKLHGYNDLDEYLKYLWEQEKKARK